MIGVRPCPCGGEVEVVKLNKKKGETKDMYRISCRHCGRTVARGFKFEGETDEEGMERIKDYEAFIAHKMGRITVLKYYSNYRKPSEKDLLISAGEW